MDRTTVLEPNHGMTNMTSTRYGALLTILLAVGAVGFPGCAEPGGLIDRTQTNLVDKSVFQGDWWFTETIVGVDDDTAWAINQAGGQAPWSGQMAFWDLPSRSAIVGRIRWVIDENYLYAYRSSEIVVGAAEDPDDPEYRGQPMAVFAIEAHVDVRREYSSYTGEPTNVISESQDRRWYDRQYIRVDWSKNLATWGVANAGITLDALFGAFTREPVDSFFQEGGDSRIPDSWRPTFVRVGDDTTYRFQEDWPAEMADTIHYMSFVTNEIWTPTQCYDTSCNTSIRLNMRHSFLRVPPNHEYAVETLPNSEFDRFGIFRNGQRTYIRGGNDRSTTGTYCDARCVASCDVLTCTNDSDCGDGGTCSRGQCTAGSYPNPDQCGAGGICSMSYDAGWGRSMGSCSAGTAEDADDCGGGTMCNYATNTCDQNIDAACGPGLCDVDPASPTHNLCLGGLTPDYGETDFLTFYRFRHNFYSDSLTDTACVGDWQCDGSRGAGQAGSRCDSVAHRCTIPVADRPIRPVSYTLSPHFPTHVVRSAFQVVGQWNETFMYGNRELHGREAPTGPRVQCQDVDPTQYCFCGETVSALEVADDQTCAYRENFFIPPSEREAMGVTEPYDCWIGLRQDDGSVVKETPEINPPHPTSFSEYTDEVYRYAFEGSECMFMLNVNSCDLPVAADQPHAACEELGDLRYQFFNFVSGAGSGFCGVAGPESDPTNGEAIVSQINIAGLCLDSVSSNAINLWPVLRGEASEDEYFTGENLRGYFSRLGDVHYPVGMAPAVDGAEYEPEDGTRPALPTNLIPQFAERLDSLSGRILSLQGAQGRSSTYSERIGDVAGTALEQRMVRAMAQEGPSLIEQTNPTLARQLSLQLGAQPSADDMMDQLSPFREGFRDLVTPDDAREQLQLDQDMHMPRDALFTSRYNHWWAEAFRGRDNAEGQVRFYQGFLVAVMLHEMGHAVGLEHNFAGSYDRDHYADGYFNLVTQRDETTGRFTNALPQLDDFDCGRDGMCPGAAGYPGPDATEGDATLTGAELEAWRESLRQVRTARAEAGIGNYMSASIMDYPGDYSDMAGLGHYDRAATYFNYFNLVEAFQGDPEFHEGSGSSLEGLLRSDTTPRVLWSYYRGGESCSVDTDCPYSQGSGALVDGQSTYQRCVRNPRYSNIPEPCAGDRNCICSNFDEDMVDLAEGAYPGFGTDEYHPVTYMFCTNSRLNDISWCNVFDAGESFQETVDHWRQMWQEAYPRSYFRDYRRHFSSGSRARRYIVDAAKMYQHLFYRYYYEPSFRAETGPLGFLDQMMASIDAMNWLAELAQLPDVGSYRIRQIGGPETCDPTNPGAPGNSPDCQYGYEHMGTDLDMPGSDINLSPGLGYYNWSRYQDGLYGFFRMQRAGVFWDKLVALQALTVRDWGLSFTLDERFFINFYDLFPVEMTELFGGFALDDPTWMAPRLRVNDAGDPEVYYLNLLRTSPFGACRNPTTGDFIPCDGSTPDRFPDPPILGTSNEILRVYAAIFALAEFPVFYDPTFEAKMSVFKMDNADGFTIPDVQQDGLPTQAFGAAIPGSGHTVTTNPDDADYIVYISDRLHAPYVAVKVRQRLTYNLEEEQLGFQLLLRLYNQQERLRELEALPTPTDAQRAEATSLRDQLTRGESFMESLIEVERIFGLTSWL